MASVPPPYRPTWKEWAPVVSAIGILVGASITSGGVLEKVQEALRRIAAIEAREDQRDRDRTADIEKLNAIDVRTARIETKIDVLTPVKEPGR